MIARTNRGSALRILIVAGTLAGFGILLYAGTKSAPPVADACIPAEVAKPAKAASADSPASVPGDERAAAFKRSVAAGAAMPNYPKTPDALLRAFWQAASKKDYATLVVLAPGSVESDYKRYYDQWTPGPATAVGAPEPHPSKPSIQVYPVKVPFPGFPNKTLKMAIQTLPDGRIAVDGTNTIWW